MKRLRRTAIIGILLAAFVALLLGCGPSANQLAGEKAFYEAKVSLSKAASSQPVFEMVSGDPGKPIVLENVSAIRVFQLPAGNSGENLSQYQQRDYAQPWINLVGTTMSVGLPWWGAYKMVGAVADVVGKTGNVTNTGNTTTTTSIATTGNNNKTQIAGDMNLTATTGAGNGGTITIDTPSLIYDASDSTHAPTVVEQPPPVIVEQPPPVIVEQPAPVIVEPSYPPANP
jgi:hypothetical protein